jgi:zinc protease
VATQVWYHVGAANEAKDSRGLAHLFEHLMFGATTTSERGDYSRFVTSVGGEDNAYTSPDETVYVSEVPPEAVEQVLRLEGRQDAQSLADGGQSRQREEDRHGGAAPRHRKRSHVAPPRSGAARAAWANIPMPSTRADRRPTSRRRRSASCRAFYDAYYHPNNAHLVVVGPVDPSD